MSYYVYAVPISDPNVKADKDLLGGKGYGLWKMRQAGIPVPFAYIIPTLTCKAYMNDPAAVMAEIREKVIPEIIAGLKAEFGYMPLVAVRSGARDSMPGMMDTILNVGLDISNFEGWYDRLGAKCVGDSFSRLIEMYANVVDGYDRKIFEGKDCAERRKIYFGQRGKEFPNAADQLLGAIEAVFKSWNNERAKTYRKLNNIPDDLGTAVVIQAMVFGNFNEKSATGVAFSRNFSNGVNEIVGDVLFNAQGEDVVAGIRNPEPLSAIKDIKIAAELVGIIGKLEKMYRDMVDVEFTIQDGKLYMLQSRVGKRTAQAAVRIAVDMVEEGLITVEEALARVSLKQFLAATRPSVDAAWAVKNPPHAKGVPASNGCASGVAVFSSADAINCKEPCILIAEETTPDDIGGMHAARGILTSTGGATSHAAVVARGMDKVCVVGCEALRLSHVDKGASLVSENVNRIVKPGDKITIDGSSGAVWVGVDVPVQGGVEGDIITRFLALLEKKFAFYRTVTKASELNGAAKVLVATYALDRDDTNLEVEFDELLKAIGGREAIIDLRSFADFVREADAPLEFMFGDRETHATERKVALIASDFYKEALANATILELGLSKEQIEYLKDKGLKLLPKVDTIGSLLSANGLVVADFDALLKVMSREDVLRVLALKKNAGETVRSFNIVEQVMAEQLNRNALFALSPLEAAQSFLGAGA